MILITKYNAQYFLTKWSPFGKPEQCLYIILMPHSDLNSLV